VRRAASREKRRRRPPPPLLSIRTPLPPARARRARYGTRARRSAHGSHGADPPNQPGAAGRAGTPDRRAARPGVAAVPEVVDAGRVWRPVRAGPAGHRRPYAMAAEPGLPRRLAVARPAVHRI